VQIGNLIALGIHSLSIEDSIRTKLNALAEFNFIKKMGSPFEKCDDGLDSNLKLPKQHGVLMHLRKSDSSVIFANVGGGVSYKGHECIQSHCLKVLAIEFNPIHKTDILNAVNSVFDKFIGRNVFVISVLSASTFPVDTCLGSGIACTHIGWFGV
jgi:hypothetical protein